MKKRSLSIIFCVLVLAFFVQTNVLAAAPSIILSQQNLIVDGKVTAGEVYNVGGSSFINLRDLAYLLNGTESQFSVNWDSKTNTIIIQTGKAYEANGSELKSSSLKVRSSDIRSSDKVVIDGNALWPGDLPGFNIGGNTLWPCNPPGYNIGGSNYFKLQDLCFVLGFGLDYDTSENTVIITSMTSVHVSNATELLNAIASNKKVILSPGTYNLSLVNASSVKNEHIQWHAVSDGSEAIINSVKNCVISGSTDAEASIVVDSQYANVLNFSDSSYIRLANLTIGHTKSPATWDSATQACPGVDLKFSNTSYINTISCKAYGNGPLRYISDGDSGSFSM